MKRRTLAIICATVAILVSCRYLDRPLALLVEGVAVHNPALSQNLPDLLLLAVFVITPVLWGCYFHRYHLGVDDTRTRFFRLAAWTVPLAFVLKSMLKQLFGRVNTRYWLVHRSEPDFLWFGGGDWHNGFPSGHMAVVTALMVSIWLFYPRLRPACLVFMVVPGVALIATNYHFLGDVLAGAWLGVMVNIIVARCLDRLQAGKSSA